MEGMIDDGWPEELARSEARSIRPMLDAYRAKPGNEAGGALHLVIDDGNVDDDDVRFCVGAARERGDIDGVTLGEALLALPRSARAWLLDVFEDETEDETEDEE